MSKKFLIDIEVDGNVTADAFVKEGGTSSQFLKADGSSDATTYLTSGDIDTPAIKSDGSTPSLNTNITGEEVRTLIGAGTSNFSGSYTNLTNVPTEFNPTAHNHDDRYFTETEINNKFSGAAAPSGYNKSDWDTAFGWGDHSTQGYLTSETDSQTLSISGFDLSISNGNTVTLPSSRTDEEIQDVVNTMLQAGNGITLDYDDANNELTIESDLMEQTVENDSGSTIAAGVPVYQSGVSGNNMAVQPADANNASAMPAIGITAESIAAGATGKIVFSGLLRNLNTSSYSVGDVLYVSNSATLTSTPPTGEGSKIQNIARVVKSHASSGELLVTGAGRSNATPNLNNGNIFLGNGSNQAATTSLDTAVGNAGYIKDYTVTESDVTAHEGALTITESQISDLSHFSGAWADITGKPSTFTPSAHTLDSHSNVTITSNSSGEILKWNGSAWINNTLAEAGIASVASIPTATSDLTNDSGFISSTSGNWTGTFDGQEGTYYLDYNNFTNTPTIPTATSDLTNDSGFITDGNTNWNNSYGFITASSTDTLTNKSGNISQWTNDSGYSTFDGAYSSLTGIPSTFAPSAHTLASHSDVTISSIASGEILKWNGSAWVNNTLAEAGVASTASIPTATSDLTNDSGFITDGNTNWNNSYGFITASSTDTLTNKSGNISQWTNDSGYSTFDGAYSSLTGIPSTFTPASHTLQSHSNVTISSVGSGEILKYNGSAWVNNTLAEAGIASTASIPTATSDLTNDSGFISSTSGNWSGTFDGQEGSYYLDYNNFTNTPTIPADQTLSFSGNSLSISGGNSVSIFNQDLDSDKNVAFNSVSSATYIKMGDDSTTPTSGIVGRMRYRQDANNSYVDMVMKTDTSTYEWVNIVTNSWT